MTTLWSGAIPEDALEIVQHRIDRLARRAVRQGFPVPTMRTGERGIRDYQGLTVRGIDITIEAEDALRLGHYIFVGTVSELAGGEPFITYAPGQSERRVETPAAVNWCDHCRTNRARNDTYIVRAAGATDTYQVGSSCIKDFTGHSPAAIVGWLRAVEEVSLSDEEVDGWYRNATRFYDPKEVIGIAARLVAKDGYVSKAKAEESDSLTSTTELLRGWMTARGRELAEYERDYPASAQVTALEDDTWTAILRSNSTSEWESDIVRLAQSEGVQWRHVGILGSAVILGLRLQERRARDAARGESSYVGSEGERLTLTVKVTGKFAYSGAYGSSYVIRMVANESDELVTFASATNDTDAIEAGNKYQVTGTVKKHELDSRSGRPTTVLTRCKWVGWG